MHAAWLAQRLALLGCSFAGDGAMLGLADGLFVVDGLAEGLALGTSVGALVVDGLAEGLALGTSVGTLSQQGRYVPETGQHRLPSPAKPHSTHCWWREHEASSASVSASVPSAGVGDALGLVVGDVLPVALESVCEVETVMSRQPQLPCEPLTKACTPPTSQVNVRHISPPTLIVHALPSRMTAMLWPALATFEAAMLPVPVTMSPTPLAVK